MILKRKEYLGTKDGNDVLGRDYFINSDSERVVDENFNPFYNKTRYENEINNLIDEFEEGYNRLEEIDGVLYLESEFENSVFVITPEHTPRGFCSDKYKI